MRILLVYPDLDTMVSYPVGMGLISACLREAGHDTRVVHLNQELGRPMDIASCEQEARQYGPELVGFSCTSGQFKFVRQLAPLYKHWLNVPILCGGIHATVAPDEVLSTPGIDLICRGEGEEAVVELADALAHGRDWRAIHNLGYLQDGQATLNPLRPLVADLDRLPYPDRQRFDFGRIVELKRGFANLMAGRGCLFHCTYCVNNFFHKAYAGIAKGRQFTRMRSVGRVLGEIQEMLRFDTVRFISFDDDLFTMDKAWLAGFCAEYKKSVRRPFGCNVRVTHFDDEIGRLLAEAGCQEVRIGVESGCEEIRRTVMGRRTSDQQILQAFEQAEHAGLRAWSLNMIGVPHETWASIGKTVELNARLRAYIMRCAIFYPYPGTALHEYCKQHGLFNQDNLEKYVTHLEGTVLKLPDLSEADILKAKKLFKWMVDAASQIELAGFYRQMVDYFMQLPDQTWLDGRAQHLQVRIDQAVDELFQLLRKEHYTTRKHIDLNFTPKLDFQLP